jgi:hypothetical protein
MEQTVERGERIGAGRLHAIAKVDIEWGHGLLIPGNIDFMESAAGGNVISGIVIETGEPTGQKMLRTDWPLIISCSSFLNKGKQAHDEKGQYYRGENVQSPRRRTESEGKDMNDRQRPSSRKQNATEGYLTLSSGF